MSHAKCTELSVSGRPDADPEVWRWRWEEVFSGSVSAEYEHPLGADRPGISKDEDVVMQQQQLSFSRTLIERLMLHVTLLLGLCA